MKKRSLHEVNEHFESIFNAVNREKSLMQWSLVGMRGLGLVKQFFLYVRCTLTVWFAWVLVGCGSVYHTETGLKFSSLDPQQSLAIPIAVEQLNSDNFQSLGWVSTVITQPSWGSARPSEKQALVALSDKAYKSKNATHVYNVSFKRMRSPLMFSQIKATGLAVREIQVASSTTVSSVDPVMNDAEQTQQAGDRQAVIGPAVSVEDRPVALTLKPLVKPSKTDSCKPSAATNDFLFYLNANISALTAEVRSSQSESLQVLVDRLATLVKQYEHNVQVNCITD